MKLFELLSEKQSEHDTMFVTFKATSPKTDRVYYGYAPGDSDEDARRSFLQHAHTNNPDRGDTKFITFVGDLESIKVKALDLYDDEAEAFAARNDLRAQDSASISGPSNFPGGVFKRMMAMNPERANAWKLKRSVNDMTAREAMGEEGLSAGSKLMYAAVKELVASNPKIKAAVTADLDTMKYPDFMAKYFGSKA